jgi:hypothetical protein
LNKVALEMVIDVTVNKPMRQNAEIQYYGDVMFCRIVGKLLTGYADSGQEDEAHFRYRLLLISVKGFISRWTYVMHTGALQLGAKAVGIRSIGWMQTLWEAGDERLQNYTR